jgi:hypothetical protein
MAIIWVDSLQSTFGILDRIAIAAWRLTTDLRLRRDGNIPE